MFSKHRPLGNYLEVFYCYAYGPPRYRQKTTTSKKKAKDPSSRAEAIKRLNKENKSMFGQLLDRPTTRAKLGADLPRVEMTATITSKSNSPGRTSQSTKGITSLCRPTNGIQFELNKYKLKTHIKTDESLSQGRPSLSDDIDSTVITEQMFEIGDNSSKTSLDIASVTEQKDLKLTSTAQATNVFSPTFKTPQLILPDIIIRNITSFPLLNEQKEALPTPPPSGSLLNIPRDNKEYYSYPSVSKILNATMSDTSRAALDRWKKKMIAELGEKGFEEFYQGQLLRGSQFHSIVESYLQGTPPEDLAVTAEMEGCWHSLSSVIPHVGAVQAVESHAVHPALKYRGVIDCVAVYKGHMSLIEWKKSDKPKTLLASTYDAPLQMSAYLGALNYDLNYNFQLRHGAVVVAYTDGTAAQVFPLALTDCTRYWGLWLRRLQQYWLQQSSTDSSANAEQASVLTT